MTNERSPMRERSLAEDESKTTSWDMALERLANPESPRTSWLATTSVDGRPHLMPVNTFWIDGAFTWSWGRGRARRRISMRTVGA